MATLSSMLAWRIPTDRGTWWGTVHGVAKSQTGLGNQAQKVGTKILLPYFRLKI